MFRAVIVVLTVNVMKTEFGRLTCVGIFCHELHCIPYMV